MRNVISKKRITGKSKRPITFIRPPKISEMWELQSFTKKIKSDFKTLIIAFYKFLTEGVSSHRLRLFR
ncbi:hypothetical protein DPV73_17400 [Leptospira mayottensis]|nr:hypothetical protein DPV73_17400 [Leptospira mayottensis]